MLKDTCSCCEYIFPNLGQLFPNYNNRNVPAELTRWSFSQIRPLSSVIPRRNISWEIVRKERSNKLAIILFSRGLVMKKICPKYPLPNFDITCININHFRDTQQGTTYIFCFQNVILTINNIKIVHFAQAMLSFGFNETKSPNTIVPCRRKTSSGCPSGLFSSFYIFTYDAKGKVQCAIS